MSITAKQILLRFSAMWISTLFLICAVFSAAWTADEDEDDVLTIGLHNRANGHPVGGIDATCIGIKGIQNPFNRGRKGDDGTVLLPSTPQMLVESSKPSKGFQASHTWKLKRPMTSVSAREWRDVRGEIKVLLTRSNGNVFIMGQDNNGKLSYTSDKPENFVIEVSALGQIKAKGERGNAGGHVVLTSQQIYAEIIPEEYLTFDGKTDLAVKVQITPDIYTSRVAFEMLSPETTPTLGHNTDNVSKQSINLIKTGQLKYKIDNARYFIHTPATDNTCTQGRFAQWRLRGTFTVEGIEPGKLVKFVAKPGFVNVGASYGSRCLVTQWHNGESNISFHLNADNSVDVNHSKWLRDVKAVVEMSGDTPKASQFYEWVLREENAHKVQFETPNHRIVGQWFSVDRVKALIDKEVRFADLATAQAFIKAAIDKEQEASGDEFKEGKPSRCAIEREVKINIGMPQPYNLSCAYPDCIGIGDPGARK